MMTVEDRLIDLGLRLPQVPVPAGNYVPSVRVGNMLYTAGAICFENGEVTVKGKVGDNLSIEQGYEGARLCALNILAMIKAEIGSLELVERMVTVTGFVNATPGFEQSPAVINGASDLFGAVFGEAGRHARAAVGVIALPLGSAVEVQASVLLKEEA